MTGYTVRKVYITKNRYPGLYAVMDDFARKAKLLRNAALFRIRNNFTARNKEHLTANETEVRNEILNTHFKKHRPKAVISYTQLDRIMRDNNNPDYFSGLPMQSAEEVLKGACRDFKGWLSALKDYKAHPEKYLGKPKMPQIACFWSIRCADVPSLLYIRESLLRLSISHSSSFLNSTSIATLSITV